MDCLANLYNEYESDMEEGNWEKYLNKHPERWDEIRYGICSYTPWVWSVKGTIELFQSLGWDLNQIIDYPMEEEKGTALEWAGEWHYIEIFRMFLEFGANPNQKGYSMLPLTSILYGHNPSYSADRGSIIEFIKLLHEFGCHLQIDEEHISEFSSIQIELNKVKK